LQAHEAEIETGQFVLDECHLLAVMCVVMWGKTNLRIEVPIRNEKDRQTYYGRWTRRQKNSSQEYSAGNGENTVASLNIFKSNVRVAGRDLDGAAITRVRK